MKLWPHPKQAWPPALAVGTWAQGDPITLAQLRGRNAEWAELAVREAATLTAEEALAENVVDYLADTPAGLVEAVHGATVEMHDAARTLDTEDAVLRVREPDWRNWVEQTRPSTQALVPVFEGEAESIPWNNVPGEALR